MEGCEFDLKSSEKEMEEDELVQEIEHATND